MPLRKGMRFGLPSRNSCFLGREEYLRELRRLLVNRGTVSSGSQNATSCILRSRSGLGKTEIVVEFAYRNRDFFDCVIFLNGSNEHDLLEEFQCLAKYLGIHANDLTVIDRIKESFEKSELRWLLILDDIQFELDSLLAKGKLGSIIMTTCKATTAELGHAITIKPLNEKQGAALMRQYLEWAHHRQLSPSFKDKELWEISRKFGNHPPYLLKIISASIDYESSHQILRDSDGRGQTASIFRRTSTNTSINFIELPRTSLNLLLVMAYLDGDLIPKKLLLSSSDNPDIPINIGCADPFKMRETIRPLRKKGLVSRKPGGLSINRDLQLNILCWLDIFTTLRDAAFASACNLVGRMIHSLDALQMSISSDSNNAAGSAIPHAMRLYENIHQTPGNKLSPLAHAITLSKASQDSWARMSGIEGNTTLKAALAIIQAVHSQVDSAGNGLASQSMFDFYNHTRHAQDRARSLERDTCAFLGAISSQNGLEEYQESMTYRRSPLQIRLRYTKNMESAFPITRDTDLLLQHAYSDLSFGLLYQGDYSGADRVLEIYRGHYEEWDPDKTGLSFEYAKYYLVKSFTLMASGDSSRALQSCQRAIDFLRERYHDTWLFSHYQFVQATMYFYTGQAMKALELHEVLLEERSSCSLAEDDIRHVESVYMVAALSYFTGDYKRALELCESILEYGLEKLPEECARLQYILSQTYLKLGMIDDAKIMSEAAKRFRLERTELIPREEPLAEHDYFCSFYTRLTSKLKWVSVGIVASFS
ncbi:uncharacterized protein F4807DRAFT_462101 [Annulohypoxylon truncatum]|uniref:uncharacterized protein n=1 Tax=Annulohypoxylon truncatum TaxID=327061 RepID=UPI0020072EAB|nr:uncharacterized protein F4807DRAFT_462101 [Annulohypoxylon truncatum]KAI1208010.1 hypothetical protein F4807DRAFT_462101 [Annulohypoxylon truncatum]